MENKSVSQNILFPLLWVGLLLMFSLAGCASPSSLIVDTITPTAPTILVSTTNLDNIPATSTIVPKATKTLIPTKTLEPEKTCPELLPADSSILLQGSILFSYWEEDSPSGIWSISEGGTPPFLILDPPDDISPAFYSTLSPNGTLLAWNLYKENVGHPQIVIYDLQSQQYEVFSPNIPWSFVVGWNGDDQLILRSEESELNEEPSYFYYDYKTQEIEKQINPKHIPEDYYEDSMKPWDSFVSFDPLDELVLYTTLGQKGTDIILGDQKTGEIFWRKSLEYVISLPIPDWTNDGRLIALSFWTSDDGGQYKLFILSRDGQLKELMEESIGTKHYYDENLEEYVDLPYDVRYLDWSPDEQYLHYAIGLTPLRDGPGYILNLSTGIALEICDPNIEEFYEGSWLPYGNQLIYITIMKNGDAELRLLDVEKWQTQILAVIEDNHSARPFVFHGWSPVNFQVDEK